MSKPELTENIKLLAPLPQCIMVWDRSLCCKSISKSSVYNLFGLESRFVENKFFGDLPISNDARLRIRKAFDLARASGRRTEMLQSLFINNVRTAVETSFIPQFEEGCFVGIITVCHSSNTIKELRNRTEALLRATAHDLRTHVNNLQNLCKLLNVASSEETSNSIVKRMTDSIVVLSDQLEGMMKLAENHSDEAPPVEDIDVSAAVEEVANVFHDELASVGGVLTLNIKVDQIAFAKGCFRSILFNLIGNAIKYRSEERTLCISVQTHPAENGLWLEVSDNGIGIDLVGSGDRLFKPFTRLTKQGHGHGVGLSLVKSFVEGSGGEITVVSEPGSGTTFRVFLPSQSGSARQYMLFDQVY